MEMETEFIGAKKSPLGAFCMKTAQLYYGVIIGDIVVRVSKQ